MNKFLKYLTAPGTRIVINCAVILSIGLFAGSLSAQYMINRTHSLGAIKAGEWTAWPFVGGFDIDPYTSARIAIDGSLPLGAAEGVAFEADRDTDGKLLIRECEYQLIGTPPPASFWTLSTYTPDGDILKNEEGAAAALLSLDTVRLSSRKLAVRVGNIPHSGNWLQLSGTGTFKMVLRLYNTPATSNVGISELSMPVIERMECR